MANKSIRDLRRKKRREKKNKRRKKIIKLGMGALILVSAFKIDFGGEDSKIPIRNSAENRTALGIKKDEIKEEKFEKKQKATPLGFEDVEVEDELKIENDGYSDYMKYYVKALTSQYCYQEPRDFTKTDFRINKGDYIEYYGSQNSFSKIKIGDDFYYVNRYGLSKLPQDKNINVVRGIIFVNENNSLPEDFKPGLDQISQNALNTMINNMNREGLDIKFASDYRMPETEEKLKDQAHIDHDEPLKSEHQTGTAFDFFTKDSKYSLDFKETDEYKWLRDNAYKYGFIERYTSEKEDVTGISERPWHFRYVGVENAKNMYENNLSLEEYLKTK